MQNILENENLSNIYVASLHLKEAAKLLQYEHPELSLTFYNLIKILIENSGILEEDLTKIDNFENE